MKKVLLIIAKTGFQDHELVGVRHALLTSGFDVLLASTETGMCTGKYGSVEQASIAFKDVDVVDYDRVSFIGGPGAGILAENPEALRIARDTVKAGLPLGAICIAPTILATAGVLQGKKATVWDDGKGTQKTLLMSFGAIIIDAPVVVDGLIVTGNGPEAVGEFRVKFTQLQKDCL